MLLFDVQFKVVGPNKRANSPETAAMWDMAWQGELTDAWTDFWNGQLRRITDMVVAQTLYICALKSIVVQVFYAHILPHYKTLDPNGPQAMYVAVDEWSFPEPPPEHKAMVEKNAVTLWSSLTLVKGVKVMLLTNIKGSSNKTLTTGLVGEVTGFQQYTMRELADRLQRHSGLRSDPAEVIREVRLQYQVATGNGISAADVHKVITGGAQDVSLWFPHVRFFDPRTRTNNHVTVFPVTFDVQASDGKHILGRTMEPLVSADVVKPGQSLGCTTEKDIFIDPCSMPTSGTQPFMAVSRQGNPTKVFLDRNTPIGEDMFAVSDTVRAWYLGDDWQEVHVPVDPNVQGPFQALAV